ncbi:MAG: serine--tRNA ligase, partial [Aeromicrobium sp.]|nr:serine--tRNA ligase [Aeromicrobium sp.]
MIDPRILRDDPEAVRAAQRRRGEPTEIVDELIAADELRRSSIVAYEAVRGEQNKLGKLIPKAQGDE